MACIKTFESIFFANQFSFEYNIKNISLPNSFKKEITEYGEKKSSY